MNWRAGNVTLRPVAVAPFPDGEAHQLQTGELPADEVNLGVGQLPAGVGRSLRRILTSMFMASLREVARPRSDRAWCYCVAMRSRVRDRSAGEPIRFHSQCCRVFSPTSTGSAGVKRWRSSR